MSKLEIWSDSFHEGNWFIDNLIKIHEHKNLSFKKKFLNKFIPYLYLKFENSNIELLNYGAFKSWDPVPNKILDLLSWGKPDIILYDRSSDEILLAIEETAAIPTGNQALQRCERLYGCSFNETPFWYLLAEYGLPKDGGIRRDSIFPTIMSLKLSLQNKTPSFIVHYSDLENPEGYDFGKGVSSLFEAMYKIIENHASKKQIFKNLEENIKDHIKDMLRFIDSQYENIIDTLPGIHHLGNEELVEDIADIVLNKRSMSIKEFYVKYNNFLSFPLTLEWFEMGGRAYPSSELIKFDILCSALEGSLDRKKSYIISSNAGSKPQPKERMESWISSQRKSFNKAAKRNNINASFNIDIKNFPKSKSGNYHVTTSKNILYMFDEYRDVREIIEGSYPRLINKICLDDERPSIVYISNSISPGRIFGDPFTGQIACYASIFGKYDMNKRYVIIYYPHQSFGQFIDSENKIIANKGFKMIREIADLVIFGGGVAIKFNDNGKAFAL